MADNVRAPRDTGACLKLTAAWPCGATWLRLRGPFRLGAQRGAPPALPSCLMRLLCRYADALLAVAWAPKEHLIVTGSFGASRPVCLLAKETE